jgi:hypothetical protein
MIVGNMRFEKHKKLNKNLIIVETGYRKLLTFYTRVCMIHHLCSGQYVA